MPVYVTDTHPIIWHLTADANLGGNARRIFEEADKGIHTIWIPSIVLVEVVYICEKKGILQGDAGPFLNHLANSPNYPVAPLDVQIVQEMQRIPRATITGMPDRIIVATSIRLQAPLISTDQAITNSGLITVVW